MIMIVIIMIHLNWGFRVKENIGIAVINPRGITKANKNTFIK